MFIFLAICLFILSLSTNAFHFRTFTTRGEKTFSSITVHDKSTPSLYIERMVQRKKIEVDGLLRRHQEPDDPLVMRMSYMASKCLYNITNALKRDISKEGLHTMSVLIDMKRRSPTIPQKRNIVEFSNAAKFAELLTLTGSDAFLINTDELEYGGNFGELKACVQATRMARPSQPPACIHKDIIIHPVQIAQALEQGYYSIYFNHQLLLHMLNSTQF